MASVFTFDPDPPRVSSPWSTSEADNTLGTTHCDSASTESALENGVQKLRPEPQEGPMEYKLHLLLRPRRAYTRLSTREGIPTSSQSTNESRRKPLMPNALSSSKQLRQERLKHLTTQLLWRLQQSSPYHLNSSKELFIPRYVDDCFEFDSSVHLEPLVPGLEESQGALYEIGVSDDGTLIGLTKDEMAESLRTLRTMAASLGCTVEVIRMITVGDCEWNEASYLTDNEEQINTSTVRSGTLWVSEALVTPHLGFREAPGAKDSRRYCEMAQKNEKTVCTSESAVMPSRRSSATAQLRVTLTGATTSGKSTLLGTLTTGALDNGRGKSRLGLLKHRHELISGVTSSIAQELIGYKQGSILNFSREHIESWLDIHDRADDGRLVFLSDSGGHPRYRRTVLRGLMNWAPHWSVVCVAADAAEDIGNNAAVSSAEQDALGTSVATIATDDVDKANTHLTLTLKLNIPVIVAVTKLDLASRSCLQKTMNKVLAVIKSAGRKPRILQPDLIRHDDLHEIPIADLNKAEALARDITTENDEKPFVPILFTSATHGTGIGLLHALLFKLPPFPTSSSNNQPRPERIPGEPRRVFHIDDTFNLPTVYCALATGAFLSAKQGIIVSGYLRSGSLSIGESVWVGPFPSENEVSQKLPLTVEDLSSPISGNCGLTIPQTSLTEVGCTAIHSASSVCSALGEWHSAQVVSIRNLRLPVRALASGQVGSVGVAFKPRVGTRDKPEEVPKVRRGMVMVAALQNVDQPLQAASGFAASFSDHASLPLVPGSLVNVYIASIRASARISRVSEHQAQSSTPTAAPRDDDGFLGFAADPVNKDGMTTIKQENRSAEVEFELLFNREWIEVGSKVVVLEGGSQDRSGFKGRVGIVREVFD